MASKFWRRLTGVPDLVSSEPSTAGSGGAAAAPDVSPVGPTESIAQPSVAQTDDGFVMEFAVSQRPEFVIATMVSRESFTAWLSGGGDDTVELNLPRKASPRLKPYKWSAIVRDPHGRESQWNGEVTLQMPLGLLFVISDDSGTYRDTTMTIDFPEGSQNVRLTRHAPGLSEAQREADLQGWLFFAEMVAVQLLALGLR